MRILRCQSELLTPASGEMWLKAEGIRLSLLLPTAAAVQIARKDGSALDSALNGFPLHHGLHVRVLLRTGVLPQGMGACWIGIVAPTYTQATKALRLLHALVAQHVAHVEPPERKITDAQRRRGVLLELEREGGWRMALTGGLDLLREQMKHAASADLDAFPRLRLARIYLMCKDDRLQDAEREWRELRRLMAQHRYPDLPMWEVALIRELVAGYAESPVTLARFQRMQRLSKDIPSGDSQALGVLYNCLCLIAVEARDPQRAYASGEFALQAYARAGSMFGSMCIHYHLGLIHAVAGHYGEARRHHRRGAMLGRKLPGASIEYQAIGKALQAGIDYAGNRLEQAASGLDAVLISLEQIDSWSDLLWRVYRTYIDLAALERDAATLERAFLRARQVANARGFRRLDAYLGLLEIEIHLRHERIGMARRRARERQLSELCQREPERDLAWRELIYHARYLHLLLHLEQAQPAQVQTLIDACRSPENFTMRVRCLLLRAQLDVQRGESASAWCAIDDVLTMILPERPLRIVLDHPGIHALLAAYRRVARQRRVGRDMQRLLSELERQASADQRVVRAHAHCVTLTPKELLVIGEVAHGRRRKEIAERLRCSEDTVKFHLKQMSRKLGARRRAELAARAREAGLIE